MIEQVNILGQFLAGRAAGREVAKQNFLATNAGALMAGDSNAMAQFAQYDPEAAMQIMEQDRQRKHQERMFQMQQAEHAQSMSMARERLDLARAEGARAAEAWAMEKSAAEVATANERMGSGLAAASSAETAEDWDRIATEFDAPELVGRFGDRDALLAYYGGIKEALDRPEWRAATPEEAQARGGTAGQINTETGQFDPINPPSGMAMRTTPDGGVEIVQGPGAKFTEAQSKDNVYATRARGAIPDLDKYESDLQSLADKATEAVPFNLGTYAQSEGYQLGSNAALEFANAILRKDTGAAQTPSEEAQMLRLFIPQPGESAALVARKRQARYRAVAAIEAGMAPTQILAQEEALASSELEAASSQATEANPTAIPTAPPQTFLDSELVRSMAEKDGITPEMLWDNLSETGKRRFLSGP